MDAIKTFLIVIFLIPILTFGQKEMYPKDTIYIYFNSIKYKKKELNHPKLGKSISFGKAGVYYNYKIKPDTLCSLHLKDYQFSNLKKIREKEIEWIDKKFEGLKHKPYSGGGLRNAAFQTYLIEIISKDYFVIYPVIWRGEGIVD